jgi:cobalamin synthase
MFANLLAPLRAKVNLALVGAACYAVAGIAGSIALAFGVAALFSWLASQYGTIAACLIVAAIFVVLAIIPMVVLAFARKAEERRVMLAAAKARQTQWINPATLSLGLQAARMLGRNRGIAMAAVGSVLAGWLISQMMGEEGADEEEEAAEPAE